MQENKRRKDAAKAAQELEDLMQSEKLAKERAEIQRAWEEEKQQQQKVEEEKTRVAHELDMKKRAADKAAKLAREEEEERKEEERLRRQQEELHRMQLLELEQEEVCILVVWYILARPPCETGGSVRREALTALLACLPARGRALSLSFPPWRT